MGILLLFLNMRERSLCLIFGLPGVGLVGRKCLVLLNYKRKWQGRMFSSWGLLLMKQVGMSFVPLLKSWTSTILLCGMRVLILRKNMARLEEFLRPLLLIRKVRSEERRVGKEWRWWWRTDS